ncbi:MAG: hypothetical protein IJS96_01110 [Schwartzia sp.]|nr:hypothetical protein [Schwartzia sp. (in: firmicutes)]
MSDAHSPEQNVQNDSGHPPSSVASTIPQNQQESKTQSQTGSESRSEQGGFSDGETKRAEEAKEKAQKKPKRLCPQERIERAGNENEWYRITPATKLHETEPSGRFA